MPSGQRPTRDGGPGGGASVAGGGGAAAGTAAGSWCGASGSDGGAGSAGASHARVATSPSREVRAPRAIGPRSAFIVASIVASIQGGRAAEGRMSMLVVAEVLSCEPAHVPFGRWGRIGHSLETR